MTAPGLDLPPCGQCSAPEPCRCAIDERLGERRLEAAAAATLGSIEAGACAIADALRGSITIQRSPDARRLITDGLRSIREGLDLLREERRG